MKTLIVFYSRTGNTRKVAAALARELDADMLEIRCDRYRAGAVRYLQAGYDSVVGNLPKIVMPRYSAEDYDLMLIGTPVWTSHPSLPVRAFLAGRPRLPNRVALFITCGGHSSTRVAIDETAAMLPTPIAASLAINTSKVHGAELDNLVSQFAGPLIGPQAEVDET
jgi:menaquinone-dependent protoporphyrinogen IX oxidase